MTQVPSHRRYYFVGHIYDRAGIDDFRGAVQDGLRDSGLIPFYADDVLRQGQIFVDKIVPAIRSSMFAIFDISGSNPNVGLEVGSAVGLERPYILVHRVGTTLPSLLEGLDRVDYQSYADLAEQLRGKARPFWQDSV